MLISFKMAMKRIPIAEQSLLCASTNINNFKKVIEELMYNSLDAASTSVAIRVCIQENFIQVLDNGNGILKDNFSLLGNKYATSKYVDMTTLKSAPDKYGFRGLSLSSIIEVSQSVEISSRHENSNDTWMKTFYNGKEKEICKTTSRPSKGTTVEIRGFLYNLNIQRKSIYPQSELQNIKITLQQLSLVHCKVSISLRDDSKNDIIFQIHKNRNIRDTMQSVFQIDEKDIQELQVEKNKYKVKAFIGKNTTESNNYYQWIYINGKFIPKSILHRKLNESLSNFLNTNTRNNKTKNMHSYEDERKYFDSDSPFYFIFITCPNYDFNINYSSEKCLTEFKNWKEVNNLIEKLAQFYSGSLLIKKIEINKKGSAENKTDTRIEIKGIMEKILNNKNKPQRISQIQNGVKGKILKRNRKKKKILAEEKILIKKTETNDPCHSRNLPKLTDVKNLKDKLKPNQKLKDNVKAIHLDRSKDSQVLKDLTNKISNQQVPKIKKTKKQVVWALEKKLNFQNSPALLNNLKNKPMNPPIPTEKKSKNNAITSKKPFTVKDALIKKFETPTKTRRKWIKYLSQKRRKPLDKNVFNDYDCVQNAYTSINNENQNQSIRKSTTTLSVHEKTHKNLKHVSSNVYISENKNKGNYLNFQNIKKSYDLLKTVITSQCNMTQTKNTLTTYCRQSYERKTNYTCSESCFPLGTYNSHNNNFEAVKRMGCFIDNISRNNFSLHEQELFPISNKNNSELVQLPLNEHKSSKKITNWNCLNKSYDRELQEFSYTIEMTDNHETNICGKDTFHSVQYNLPQDNNYIQSHHFENTYTLKGSMSTSQHNYNYTLNKTYLLQMYNTSNFHSYLEEIQPSIMQNIVHNKSNNDIIEKKNLIISESESDSAKIMPHNVEPIHYCEAVLQSHSNELRDIEKEFEFSFGHRRDNVSHSDYNFDRNENFNFNTDLQQTENNIETNENIINISHSDAVHSINVFNNSNELLEHKIDKHIGTYKNLNLGTQSLQTDINKIDSEPVYSFQFQNRHRFMPKGMSPIANNQCELRNTYSPNDDKVYYKYMIFENFANDVLINTEIFEPEVHNVKNLFPKNIEKVNFGIQKQNADLLFDCLSLTGAKILGQVDGKFITSILNGKLPQTGKSSEFLVLFDQHAVDERIRLENNLSDYILGSKWKSIDIDPISIVLSKDDYLYFVNYNDKLARFGLQWTFTSENEISLNGIPKAILGKNPRQVEIVMKAVKKLISEQINAIKSLRGNVSFYPKSIMELVFSEACRYAFKFGDKLSKSECTNMINSLAQCKTPFQCAHGRPVMAVIMELKNNNRTYKVDLTKVKKFKRIP